MNKFTLLESPISIAEHKAGKIDALKAGFLIGLDQPEHGVRHKMSNNGLRLGYYAASATLRRGS